MKICPHCKIEYPRGRSFGTHVTNCKFNPKHEQTIEKIKKSKTLERKIYNM